MATACGSLYVNVALACPARMPTFEAIGFVGGVENESAPKVTAVVMQ